MFQWILSRHPNPQQVNKVRAVGLTQPLASGVQAAHNVLPQLNIVQHFCVSNIATRTSLGRLYKPMHELVNTVSIGRPFLPMMLIRR